MAFELSRQLWDTVNTCPVRTIAILWEAARRQVKIEPKLAIGDTENICHDLN